MSEHRLDGRVAVVTGAGRGLGRAYARLLAERGARVVLNDLGGGVDGTGADDGPARAAAAEIADAGGEAVPDTSDVSTEAGGAAAVAVALEHFGRVDVVVANAGIVRWAALPDLAPADLDAHLAVHLGGSFHVTRAAWPHLVDQGYGRVVLTASTGVLGLPQNAAYAAAKGGVIGLARSLATAGARHGIRVNCIAPAASTRMAGEGGPDLPPELVAPMVALLASAACPVTGEVLVAGAGRFARLVLATTDGWVHDGDGVPAVEDLAAHWDQVMDPAGWTAPPDLLAWSARFLSHLPPTR